MSAIRYTEYTLLCDYDECTAFYGPFGVERSRAEMRKLAEKDGWTVLRSPIGASRGFDYCPDNKPDESTKEQRRR